GRLRAVPPVPRRAGPGRPGDGGGRALDRGRREHRRGRPGSQHVVGHRPDGGRADAEHAQREAAGRRPPAEHPEQHVHAHRHRGRPGQFRHRVAHPGLLQLGTRPHRTRWARLAPAATPGGPAPPQPGLPPARNTRAWLSVALPGPSRTDCRPYRLRAGKTLVRRPRTASGNKSGPHLIEGCNQVILRSELMSETLSLPVLPLDDTVVLPTMVVPLDTSGSEVRAAIDAAQMTAAAPGSADKKPQVLLVPRLDGKYSALGTLGVVEQTGRTPTGEPAAVIRGLARVRIGVGTTGPGAALWVEGTVLDEPPATPRAQELAREYRGLAATILQKRGAWQVMDVLERITDPSALADSAGYAV